MTANRKPTNGWELFNRSTTRLPSVSVYSDGQFALNAAAHQLLKADKVELLFNKSLGLVGIRAAKPGSPNAYALRSMAKQKSKTVSAKSFIRFYGLEHMKGKRYSAEIIDGMVVFGDEK